MGVPVTDPMMLQQLGGAPAPQSGGLPVTDPAMLAKLNAAPPSALPPGQKALEDIPYIGPAIGALNAATAKSQDWFGPTKFLNSINIPGVTDFSGVKNKDVAAAQSAHAESDYPNASLVGSAGGALMNFPPDTAIPINPLTMPTARTAATAIGSALGGASQGNTATERAENATYGGLAGLGMGLVGEGARAVAPLARPALHAMQGMSLPAYLAIEHYGGRLEDLIGQHIPYAAAGLLSLFGAPYFAPKAGELLAPNPSAPAPQ